MADAEERPPEARRLPRTDRTDAPAYLLRYRERSGGARQPNADGHDPLYLRSFRSRQKERAELAGDGGSGDDGGSTDASSAERWTAAWLETVRSKEIVAPPEARPEGRWSEIHVIRHGETQGYATDAGLTPLGKWQSRRRGHDLSKSIGEGERVRVVHAPSARAAETAAQLVVGILDGLQQWGRRADVVGPEVREEFRNFQAWTPDGPRDPTEAFRRYHATLQEYERTAMGRRPLWLVEIDRFWRLQSGGGDPIAFWVTTPLLHFEPPAVVVQRFLAGFARLAEEEPDGTRFLVATHSGPMRALGMWAFGHDPGEPYNVEEVKVRIRRETRQAVVTFRNRTQDIRLPGADEWPAWSLDGAGELISNAMRGE